MELVLSPAGPWAFLAFEHTRFSALLLVPHAIRWSPFVNGPGGWSRDAGHGSEAVYFGGGVDADIRLPLCPSCDIALRRAREVLESAVLVYEGRSTQEALLAG